MGSARPPTAVVPSWRVSQRTFIHSRCLLYVSMLELAHACLGIYSEHLDLKARTLLWMVEAGCLQPILLG